MTTPKTTLWRLEPHTKTKHMILRRYLEAWLPMMAKHNGRIVFVDGFAGPGRYVGGEDGSPIIAIRALLDHPHFETPAANREVVFAFFEARKDRADALKAEIQAVRTARSVPDWIKTGVNNGEFGPMMTKLLDRLERRRRRWLLPFSSWILSDSAAHR